MLRIEKDSDGCVTRLRLSGRIQSHRIACIQSAMNAGCARLDLHEVTLVDVAAVRFLITCENQGVEFGAMPSLCARMDSSRAYRICATGGFQRLTRRSASSSARRRTIPAMNYRQTV